MIQESDSTGTVVKVSMEPIEVTEQNLPSPGAETRAFTLRLDPSGEVLDVVEVGGVPASALDADQLVFIGTYRPPLATGPVRLDDEWEAQQRVGLPEAFQQIATVGELVRLGRDADGDIAHLRYTGEGPLEWVTELPQGEAELSGSARTVSRAALDIDDGFLRRADSSTTGIFEVRVVTETGTLPLTGVLRLKLDLEIERV
jgi:hypothetical protein